MDGERERANRCNSIISVHSGSSDGGSLVSSSSKCKPKKIRQETKSGNERREKGSRCGG